MYCDDCEHLDFNTCLKFNKGVHKASANCMHIKKINRTLEKFVEYCNNNKLINTQDIDNAVSNYIDYKINEFRDD